VAPGTYDENVVVRDDGLAIVGETDAVVEISPNAGVALTLTNATAVSLATYRVSGLYSDLVNQGNGYPSGFYAEGIDFLPNDGVSHAVECLGVQGDATPTTTNFGSLLLTFLRCRMGQPGSGIPGFFAKNTVAPWLDKCITNPGIDVENVSTCIIDQTTVAVDVTATYDVASPDGQPAFGSFGHQFKRADIGGNVAITGSDSIMKSLKTDFSGNITLSNTATALIYDPDIAGSITLNNTASLTLWEGEIVTNLTANDTSTVTMHDAIVGGAVSLAAGAGLVMNDCHVDGTFTAAAGAGVVTLDNSIVSGLISDAGAKITYPQGLLRMGRVTAAGAGDEAVAFSTNFPTTNYVISITPEDNGSGFGTAGIANGTRAVGGFTMTVGAAGIYHWRAELNRGS
jgi:hypothetical protein